MDMKIWSGSCFPNLSLDDFYPVETLKHVKQAVYLTKMWYIVRFFCSVGITVRADACMFSYSLS